VIAPMTKPKRDTAAAIVRDLAKQGCQIFYHDGKHAFRCAEFPCPSCRARVLLKAKRGKKA